MTGSRYVKAPTPTEQVRPLYEAILKHLSGELNVTEAAATVSLSRLRFQTRMHRGLTGLLTGLENQPRGRPATPETEKALRAELEVLRKENQQLRKQVASTARMMGLASEWMHKGLRSASRQRRTKPTAEAPTANDSEEDPAWHQLEAVRTMKADGVCATLAARAMGLSAPTVRRWSARSEKGEPLRNKRGPPPASVSSATAPQTAAVALVKALKGCIGAAALAKATGLSRRCAGRVKAEAKTRTETERRASATRVAVAPCVIRGFDGVMLGKLPVFVFADGAIDYRTSVVPAHQYDDAAVAAAMAADFEANGPPLVCRMDRAKCHTAPKVREVLRAYDVLLLQGPPHCPRFYGQLERQNREHRSWLDALGPMSLSALAAECERMRGCFNERVPRRTLGWLTPGVVWRKCTMPNVDRRELAAEVEERTQRLTEAVVPGRSYPGLTERLAIQAALTNRGLLRLTKGGWC